MAECCSPLTFELNGGAYFAESRPAHFAGELDGLDRVHYLQLNFVLRSFVNSHHFLGGPPFI